MPLQPGQILNNRYKILDVIAKGGMGAIYIAHDESLAVDVAVKENLFSTEEHLKQFHLEATLLAGLRHPNLPRVTDHFVIEGQGQYLVMDYIPGEDLKDRLKRTTTITEEETTLIGTAICDAIGYLHKRTPPIVHRDIKPGNVKITPSGQIYLVDFGLAKVVETGQATSTGAQALTPGYAPPEQYGQGTEPRSDLYALGATLYAALTGFMPEDSLARMMGTLTLTPIRQHNPKISDRLAVVIEKAMALSPDDRYQAAEEFKRALLNANTTARRQVSETGEVIVPPPPTTNTVERTIRSGTQPPSRPLTRLRSRRGIFAIGGGIFFLGIVIVAVLAAYAIPKLIAGQNPTAQPTSPATQIPIVSPSTRTAESPVDETPTETLLAVIETPAPTDTPVPEPSSTPTLSATPVGGGSLIAFTSERSGLPQIWLMNPDGSNPHQLTQVNEGACQPDFAPNGQWIVFVTPCKTRAREYKNSNLALIRVDGSSQRFLDTLPGGDFEPAFSPDGTQIAFTSTRDGRKQIFLYTLADNSVTKLSSTVSVDFQAAWSPDGTRLAFVSMRNAAAPEQVWVMNADGTNAREYATTGSTSSPAFSPDGSMIIYSQGDPPYLVARQNKAGASEIRLSEDLRTIRDARYSPDSIWYVFTFTKQNRNYIYRLNRNGVEVLPLTDGSSNDYDPVWGPAFP